VSHPGSRPDRRPGDRPGGRRLLLVHAHPDDESITTGATMARYAASGVHVTLVTCTRGEQGEVIGERWAHLFGDPDGLARHREAELAAAMRALGVHDHRFLDTQPAPNAPATRYSDSGMGYAPDGSVVPAPDPPPGAFALLDVDEPAGRLAGLLADLRPDAVVTYDPNGGYGHPDHVQAHRVTMRAVELAARPPGGGPGWDVPKLYWVVAEDQADAVVDGAAVRPAKVAALRAHETQVMVAPDEATFALSNGVSYPINGREYFRLIRGTPSGERDEHGRETDLFGGR
jgi:N-acetyl-1-D-myo-inositol-2-amino-2-deoxy-alpha-D-glucopyranoside deacetylase